MTLFPYTTLFRSNCADATGHSRLGSNFIWESERDLALLGGINFPFNFQLLYRRDRPDLLVFADRILGDRSSLPIKLDENFEKGTHGSGIDDRLDFRSRSCHVAKFPGPAKCCSGSNAN